MNNPGFIRVVLPTLPVFLNYSIVNRTIGLGQDYNLPVFDAVMHSAFLKYS
jgi:hypothetical protein